MEFAGLYIDGPTDRYGAVHSNIIDSDEDELEQLDITQASIPQVNRVPATAQKKRLLRCLSGRGGLSVVSSFRSMRTFEVLFVMYSDAARHEKLLSVLSYTNRYSDTGVQLTNNEYWPMQLYKTCVLLNIAFL